MPWTLALILLIWMLGIVNSYSFGGLIHVLPFLAVAVVLIQTIHGSEDY